MLFNELNGIVISQIYWLVWKSDRNHWLNYPWIIQWKLRLDQSSSEVNQCTRQVTVRGRKDICQRKMRIAKSYQRGKIYYIFESLLTSKELCTNMLIWSANDNLEWTGCIICRGFYRCGRGSHLISLFCRFMEEV